MVYSTDYRDQISARGRGGKRENVLQSQLPRKGGPDMDMHKKAFRVLALVTRMCMQK